MTPEPPSTPGDRSARHRRLAELRVRFDQLSSRPLPPVLAGLDGDQRGALVAGLRAVAPIRGNAPPAPDDDAVAAVLETARFPAGADPDGEASTWLSLMPSLVALGHLGAVWAHRRIVHLVGRADLRSARAAGLAIAVLRAHGYLEAAHRSGVAAVHALRHSAGGAAEQRLLFAHLVDTLGSFPFRAPEAEVHNLDERLAHATLLHRLALANRDEPVAHYAPLARRRVFQLLHCKELTNQCPEQSPRALLEAEMAALDRIEDAGGFGPSVVTWHLTRAYVLVAWRRAEEAAASFHAAVDAFVGPDRMPSLARDMLRLAARIERAGGRVHVGDEVRWAARLLDDWPTLAVTG